MWQTRLPVAEDTVVSEVTSLVVGDLDRSEFRHALAAMQEAGRVVRTAGIDEAAQLLRSQSLTPELIVLAQSFPGEFPHEAIDRLHRLAPLARVVGLLGSWCEGEMRSGSPWPAMVRLYWHQWPAQCSQQLARLVRGENSAWGLPVTASEEERLLLAAEEPFHSGEGMIAIYTPAFQMEDFLSAALRRCGYSTVWLRPPRPARVEGVRAVIFDAPPCPAEQIAQLRGLATTLGPAPLLALLDFPRIEDHDRIVEAGADAVLSKPLQLSDLFWWLSRLLEQ